MMWHFGFRYEVSNGRHRWVNKWMSRPCCDLALAFEIGPRAYHHHEVFG